MASLHSILPTNTLDWETFRGLSSEEKSEEVMRLLPTITRFDKNFNELKREIDASFNRLERINFSKVRLSLGAYTPEPFLILKTRRVNKRVTLTVGGVRHEVMWRILKNIPNSRLGRLEAATSHEEILDLCSDYSLMENESFNSILNFYRTGKLHIQEDMCSLAFTDDLRYWGIDEINLESCCQVGDRRKPCHEMYLLQFKYEKMKEAVLEEMEIEASKLREDDEDDFGDGKYSKYQKFVWELMEKPDTSLAAKGVSFISFTFVVVSTVGMMVNTLPSVQHQDHHGNMVDNPKLAMVESVCIAWFSLEYLMRFAGAPQKCQFLLNGMNLVDLLAILPYYATLLFYPMTDDMPPGRLEDVIQIFRIFKLARILKLARHSTGLQSIAFTLTHSYKELGLLLLFISIAGLLFSSLCYFLEGEEEDTQYTSIPTGKLIGTFCAISGVLVMSLPIPIITSNFEKFYKEQNKKEKASKRKNRLRLAKKQEEESRDNKSFIWTSCSDHQTQFKSLI